MHDFQHFAHDISTYFDKQNDIHTYFFAEVFTYLLFIYQLYFLKKDPVCDTYP